MVGFGGWSMPVQYTGIMDEHQAVRSTVGVFDISHMGQIFASGPGAAAWLNRLLSNNVERLDVGECQYTFLLNERGGVIDDLIVYRIEPERYLLVVNASMIEHDFAWLQAHGDPGRGARESLRRLRRLRRAGAALRAAFRRLFRRQILAPGAQSKSSPCRSMATPIYIARTGYTGEDGFEVFCPAERAVRSWRDILKRGAEFGIKPCGLGARDTLRLEMCYPLNGSDLSPARTPLEAGLSIFVDLQKEFIGSAALQAQRTAGIAQRLVPFKMDGPSPPPRAHYPILREGQPISEVTSGTLSPTLGDRHRHGVHPHRVRAHQRAPARSISAASSSPPPSSASRSTSRRRTRARPRRSRASRAAS